MNPPIKTYRDLIVWQKSMALVTEVYLTIKTFPAEEIYGLTSQIKRCAISLPSNIAEGYGRRSTQDYARFLRIACGTLFELQTQLEIAENLTYLEKGTFENLYGQTLEIEKMLNSLINKISKN